MFQTTIPQVLNCYWKDVLQKKENLVRQMWSIEETHAKQLKIQTNPVYTYSEEGIDIEEGSGMTLVHVNISEDILLKPKSQNWS